MDLQTALSNINWLSVIVATIAAFILGSLWYSPVLFGKVWQKELGLSDEKIKNANMAVIFGTSFVLEFIAALFLICFLGPEANLDNRNNCRGIGRHCLDSYSHWHQLSFFP